MYAIDGLDSGGVKDANRPFTLARGTAIGTLFGRFISATSTEGTAGQVLTSNGAGSPPSFQAAAAGAWTDDGTTISPTNAARAVQLGTLAPQLRGSPSATFELAAGSPVQAAGSLSGKDASLAGGNATAGASVAGAAKGGDVVLFGGDAARLTSGDADGGAVRLFGGVGIGTGARGRVEIGASTSDRLTFYGGGSPTTQQTVTGSRGGNVALASLLTALATLGLVVDGTT